jgi:predicted Kef-type K+ transport protein
VFLLFIVGIHLNPKIIREVGGIAAATGIGQIIFTSAVGYALAWMLGFAGLEALYIAVALTFSSTIIIMKLVSDKKDLDSLYAKISIGFLLVQDLAATAILVLLPTVTTADSSALMLSLSMLALKTMVLVVGLLLAAKWVLPRIFREAAGSSELLFFTSVTWGVSIAALFAVMGLSLEVGALAAGIALSTSMFAEEITSRLRPLRDFFLVVFFLLLGSDLALSSMGEIILPALLLSGFVLVGNPLIVYALMQFFGYTRRVSFKAGLTVAQISEFSLILVALGAQLGQLSDRAVSLVTLVGIITIGASTYAILYADEIFNWLEPWLKRLPSRERGGGETGGAAAGSGKRHVLWFGYHPVGEHLLQELGRGRTGLRATIIDHDPAHIETLSLNEADEIAAIFGDASDVEFLGELPWHDVDTVVSFIPQEEINHLIVQKAREHGQDVKLIVITKTTDAAERLYDMGAHDVILPFHLSLQHLISRL